MEIKPVDQKKVKAVSFRLVIIALIFLSALFIFSLIAREMVVEQENGLDLEAFLLLSKITSPVMTSIMLVITFFGSSYFLTPAYLVLIFYFLIFKKNRKISLDVFAFSLISTILLFTLKAIFHRHRPLDPVVHAVNGYSFPSGHSFSAFSFFGLLIYIIWNQNLSGSIKWILSILFFLLACAVAISRVYLHVHYASDVLAGFCLCILWLTISFAIIKKFNRFE